VYPIVSTEIELYPGPLASDSEPRPELMGRCYRPAQGLPACEALEKGAMCALALRYCSRPGCAGLATLIPWVCINQTTASTIRNTSFCGIASVVLPYVARYVLTSRIW
jgi:hypothetical protein